MWQVLLAAAVAGSTGFVANHLLSQTKLCNHNSDEPQSPLEDTISQPLLVQNDFSESRFESNSQAQDGIFRFSSSESLRKDGFRSRANDSKKKAVIGGRRSKHGVRVAKVENRSDVEVRSEQSKDGKRLTFSLKRRKTTKNLAGKTGFCSSKGFVFLVLFGSIEMFYFIFSFSSEKITAVFFINAVCLCFKTTQLSFSLRSIFLLFLLNFVSIVNHALEFFSQLKPDV